MKLLFATTNPGKLGELRRLVRGIDLEIVSLEDVGSEEVAEDGATFADNARKKASAHARRTGLATLADDSGLCVDALDGGPGVFSARYSGSQPGEDRKVRDQANNTKLLAEMVGVAEKDRGAQFRCALCLAVPGEPPRVVEGVCRGRIGTAARGSGGFGYDPLFELPEGGKTYAELTSEEKNGVSHRAKAFQAMRPHLAALESRHRNGP